MKTNKVLQSTESQNLQTGEIIESLSSSKDSNRVSVDWKNTQISIFTYWTQFALGTYSAEVWYQRLYRFFDEKDGNGDKWQRALMASILKFQTLPFIWVNLTKTIRAIIDGGQRTRTINAWFTNCIRLPKNTYFMFDGKIIDLSNHNWKSLQDIYPEFADYWKDNYKLFFMEGDNLEDEMCAEQFKKLNDGNKMYPQEFRTSIISQLNSFIREKANIELRDSLKIFQIKNLHKDNKKYWYSKHHKISYIYRGFDAFIAKVFYLVKSNYSEALSEPSLTKMYETERDIEFDNNKGIGKKQKTQLETYKSKVLSVLKWVDELLMGDSTVKGSLNPNELFMLLHTKFELEQSYEFKILNSKQFLDTYRKMAKAFKADDKKSPSTKVWFWKNYKGEPTSFTKSLSSMATGHPSEFREWRGIIAREFINQFEEKGVEVGFTLSEKKDDRRVYNLSEKDAFAVVQDFECMYFEYCGNHIDGINDTIAGDHSSVSHSKGGQTTIHNGAACCTKCNGQKSSFSHDEFLAVLKIRGLSDDDIERINIRKSKVEEYAEAIA
jgi:hypothetical protein